MNWADEPREITMPVRARVRGMGYVRFQRFVSPFAGANDWARWMAWRIEEKLRGQHTCIGSMSSLGCRACNRGVPYPHAEVRDLLVFAMARAA